MNLEMLLNYLLYAKNFSGKINMTYEISETRVTMSLQEIHKYLENNVKILDHLYSFTQFILSKKSESLTDTDKTKIDIENAIFSIIEHIKTKRLDWMIKAYKIISQDYNYVAQRVKQTQNPLLKAIYSEILYYSNEPQFKSYIKQAVESYYNVLKIFDTELTNKSTEDFIHSMIDTIRKLLHLAVISKTSKMKDIKALIIKITQVDNDIPLSHYLKVSIIAEMLEYNKTFKKADFEGIDDIFWDLVQCKFKEKDYHYVINIISQYAHEIDKKRGKLSYPWDDMMGLCFEKSMTVADSNLVARHWCINAIKHYTKLNKYTNKIKLLEQKYVSFKDKLEFSELGEKIDNTPFFDLAKDILKLKPVEIFKMLSASNIFYPPLENLKNQYSTFDDIFPTSYLDHNMHPSKISDLKTEQDLYLTNYRMFWQLYQITIQYIFIEGVKENKFNLKDLINYLMDYSSFFDLITKSISKNKRIRYNWSATIISIFETYFKELEKWFENPKKYYPYLVTITDSFVLKFETWIRYYLECHKQPTISSLPQENGIIREKDLNYLLYDDFIIKKFDFNDLLYFRYLFIAKEGWNLRNDIAHGILNPEQYTVELFNWVFFAFLRLSKYDFPNAERNRGIKNKTNRFIKL